MSKLCIATTISGTQKAFIVPTAKMLASRGHEVVLVCNHDDDFAASLPETIRYAPIHMTRGVSFDSLKAIREFTDLFKKENFDLVQYSTPNASLYASVAAKKVGVPIRLYCQWGIRYVGMSGFSRKLFRALEKYTCGNSTDIRCASPGNMRFAVEEGIYAAEKAAVIGHGGTIGVDLAQYDVSHKGEWRKEIRDQYHLPMDGLVFGFAGRVCADKGCQELLAAFKAVAAEYPQARLMLVGRVEKNNGIEESLFSWAQESDQVLFVGRVDNSEMKRFYSAMDVLVHPTYREGFGMVIQEAGALAVPVITTRVIGASEVMEDGISCLLVEPHDADDLRKAMVQLFQDNAKASALGASAYERTVNLYAREIMLKNQMACYEELLGETHERS